MAESKEEKLKFLNDQLTLVSVSLVNATNQIKGGKTVPAGTILDLTSSKKNLQEEIKRLEAPEPPAPEPSSDVQSALQTSNSELEPLDSGEEEDPDKRETLKKLAVPTRIYNMSQAAIRQRQNASKSPAHAKAMMGNTNAWKTGEHARSFVTRVFRPCLSSCPQYPCELIADGETAPGSVCLDKKEFVKGLMAVQKALRTGELTDVKEIMALRIAGNLDILGMLQQDILENGVNCLSEKLDKDGTVVGHELKPRPSLLALPKLTEVTGATSAENMISPREVARNKVEKKKAKTMADVWSNLGFTDKESDVEVDSE